MLTIGSVETRHRGREKGFLEGGWCSSSAGGQHTVLFAGSHQNGSVKVMVFAYFIGHSSLWCLSLDRVIFHL